MSQNIIKHEKTLTLACSVPTTHLSFSFRFLNVSEVTFYDTYLDAIVSTIMKENHYCILDLYSVQNNYLCSVRTCENHEECGNLNFRLYSVAQPA